ncbi:MAG TPA: hypothetical protein VN922_23855, partial [Bacteroidia bacterium]|nr:hypothetical protein [Bacteroidia bacterium]
RTAWGDFAVDKNSGVMYVVEAFNLNGAWAEKVNPSGVGLGTYGGTNSFREMWRAEFNTCANQIAIGGGGTNGGVNAQVAVLDTTMGSLTPQNPLGDNGPGHDVVGLAMDPTGSVCYMAVCKSSWSNGACCVDQFGDSWNGPSQTNKFPNYLFATNMPALTSLNWAIPDGYGFAEANSIGFVSNGVGSANGMNSLAASPNYLYMYDGGYLSEWSKTGGGQIGGYVNVNSGMQYNEAGIAADGCSNVYVGDGANIAIYNSALVNLTVTGVNNQVYAIRLGKNDATLWVTGVGFIQEFNNPFASIVAAVPSWTNTTCGLSNGSATASLSLCSGPAAGVSYLWMPGGQTGQTATGLASGTYTVTMSVGCGDKYTATVTIGSSTAPSLSITASPSSTICSGTSTTLNAGGGGTNYTWSTGATTTSITVNPTVNTTYTLT